MGKNKTPNLVISATLTLITAVFWIFFSLVKAVVTKPTLNIPEEVVEPFSPNLDQQSLSGLGKRSFYEPGEANAISTPTPSLSPTPTFTPTPKPSPTPEITESPTPVPSDEPEI